MNTIHDFVRANESRVLGRVFTLDERLHFVVGLDEVPGLVLCNRKGQNGVETVSVPLGEVLYHLRAECLRQEAGDGEEITELD
ncbi:MAG: hypothetical protein R3E86_21175 [Pseudomonadales bacterium]